MTIPCSVEGCPEPHHAKGYCQVHYARWRRRGDPHKTKRALNGEPRAYLLAHMHDGCCTPWPYAKNTNGYSRLGAGDGTNRMISAYRLVCELVNGPPPFPKAVTRHLCGKGHLGCFNAECLVWGTYSDNIRDSIRHGTYRPPNNGRGAPPACFKLTDQQVAEIRQLGAARAESQQSIANRYGIRQTHVSRLLAGKQRKSI